MPECKPPRAEPKASGPVLGHQIGKALCDTLGLPKGTKSFTLRVKHNCIVSIECEYYPHIDAGDLTAALLEFSLVRKPDPIEQSIARLDAHNLT